MTQTRRNSSDFNPDDLVQASDEHGRSILAMQQDIQLLGQWTSPLQSKENFALYFKEVTDSNLALHDAIAVVLKKLITENSEIRKLVADEIKKSDREWFYAFMKRIGWAIGAIILALISGLAGYWIHH